ncbi:MAG TPA: acyltransferase [Beijerinckiaceae bacterium]
MKLVEVQVLRALAALAVVVLHAQHEAVLLAAATGRNFMMSQLLPWQAGVDVFFVISGFIMVYASERLFGRPGGQAVFLAHRIARIVPLYWAVTSVYLALALVAPGLLNAEAHSPGLVAASYLFWPYARPDGLPLPVYSLGWTLNYEMFFYALFALALGLSRTRAVVSVIAGLAALVLVGRLLAPLPQPAAFWTHPIILEFAFGAALGLARANGVRLGGVLRAGLAVLGLLLLAADFDRPDAPFHVTRAFAYGLPASLLVAAAALGRPVERVGWPTRLGILVGDASYALYLVHPFAVRGLRELVQRLGLAALPAPVFVVAALVAATLVAVLVHRLVEAPAVRAAKRLLEPDAKPLPGASPSP